MKPGDLVKKRKEYSHWRDVIEGTGIILRECREMGHPYYADSPMQKFEALFKGIVVEVYAYELELVRS